MLIDKEILEVAYEYLSYLEKETGIEVVLIEESTIKKDYGTIFFFTSKKHFETKDFRYAIAGNGPFLVEKNTGKVIRFGTSHDTEFYIKGYENGTWKPALDSVWKKNKE